MIPDTLRVYGLQLLLNLCTTSALCGPRHAALSSLAACCSWSYSQFGLDERCKESDLCTPDPL